MIINWFILLPIFIVFNELAFYYLKKLCPVLFGLSLFWIKLCQTCLPSLPVLFYVGPAIYELIVANFRDLYAPLDESLFMDYAQEIHIFVATVMASVVFVCTKLVPIQRSEWLLDRWPIDFHRFYAIVIFVYCVVDPGGSFLFEGKFFVDQFVYLLIILGVGLWLTWAILGIKYDDESDAVLPFQSFLIESDESTTEFDGLVVHFRDNAFLNKFYYHSADVVCEPLSSASSVVQVPKKLCDLPDWLLDELRRDLIYRPPNQSVDKHFFHLRCVQYRKDNTDE